MNLMSAARSRDHKEASYLDEVLIRAGQLEPSKVASGSAIYTLDDTCRYAFHYQGLSDWLIMMGDTKCWVDNTGTKAVKTPATPFTSATYNQWQGFTMLHSGDPVAVVNNHGIDKPHYWDGASGDFLELGNAVEQKCSVGFLGRLWGGHVFDSSWYPNRLQTSLEGDITTWTGATAVWYDLKDEGDAIMQLGRLRSTLLLIFRRWSVYMGYATADPTSPINIQWYAGRGLHATNSLQRLARAFIYLGDDDIYVCDGVEAPQSVGWKIRKELFTTTDPALLQYAWSFLDRREREYYLVTIMKDGTQRAWIYDWEENNWTQQDLSGYTTLVRWFE